MTDSECIAELKSGSLLARVRQSMQCGRSRVLIAEKYNISTIEIRKIEFEEAQKIIDLVLAEVDKRADLLSQQKRSEITPFDKL